VNRREQENRGALEKVKKSGEGLFAYKARSIPESSEGIVRTETLPGGRRTYLKARFDVGLGGGKCGGVEKWGIGVEGGGRGCQWRLGGWGGGGCESGRRRFMMRCGERGFVGELEVWVMERWRGNRKWWNEGGVGWS